MSVLEIGGGLLLFNSNYTVSTFIIGERRPVILVSSTSR